MVPGTTRDGGRTLRAMPGRARSALATVVGWAIVALIAVLLFSFLLGTIAFLFRIGLIVIVVFGLLWAYLWLKAPD